MAFPLYTKTYHTTTYLGISPLIPSHSTAGKRILISGAGHGLGREIAISFAESGCSRIALLGRGLGSLTSVSEEIKAKHPGVEISILVADVSNEVEVNAAFGKVKEAWGGLDILVQNAAILTAIVPLASEKLDLEDYRSGFEVNVMGSIILARAFVALPASAEAERTIVHVTTAGIQMPPLMPGMAGYVSSKIAAYKTMQYFAFENADKNVRVMFVHPGILGTPGSKTMVEAGFNMPNDDILLPANFIVWLTSDEAKFLAGKLVWAHWDVGELKEKKGELEGNPMALTLGLTGWPAA